MVGRSLGVLLRGINERVSRIAQLPAPFHGNAASTKASLTRKVKLKLMLADANLVECATDETGNRKVDRNSMHTKAEYRLTRSRSATAQGNASGSSGKHSSYAGHQKNDAV